MDAIHFEKQEASLCAQHALNMLLQGSYFSASDLAEIALEVDRREGNVLDKASAQSQNVDDSGFFSVQVIAEALKIFNLEMIPLTSQRVTAYRNDPTSGQAYICNHLEHWFAVRRIGLQWFTLNSLTHSPKLITDTYLSLYFAQLINDGYSIFTVEGTLPPCSADEILMQCPIDPTLAAQSDACRDDLAFDPEIERVKALSLKTVDTHDDDMLMALKLSEGALAADDDELESHLQLAIQMSIENQLKPSTSSSADRKPDPVNSSDQRSCNSMDSSSAAQCPSSANNVMTQSGLATSNSGITDEVRSKRENFLKRFQ